MGGGRQGRGQPATSIEDLPKQRKGGLGADLLENMETTPGSNVQLLCAANCQRKAKHNPRPKHRRPPNCCGADAASPPACAQLHTIHKASQVYNSAEIDTTNGIEGEQAPRRLLEGTVPHGTQACARGNPMLSARAHLSSQVKTTLAATYTGHGPEPSSRSEKLDQAPSGRLGILRRSAMIGHERSTATRFFV